jgi:nitrate reductase NapD
VGEAARFHHISSAVVMARPERAEAVSAAIAAMDGVEIHAREAGRIVVVIEGASAGELGDRLTEIASVEGVVAANMVFEHIEELEGIAP